MGNKAWTQALRWSGHKDFNAAEDRPWGTAGEVRSAGPLTFLRVYEAGHMVPMDQPQVALDMINTFMFDGDF